MTTDTQKLQIATDALKAVKEFNKGHYSFGALDQIVEPALVVLTTPSTGRPHWIDGEQAALGGRTAREGYAENTDYSAGTEQPAAASIGADADFHTLLHNYRRFSTEKDWNAVITYIDSRTEAAEKERDDLRAKLARFGSFSAVGAVFHGNGGSIPIRHIRSGDVFATHVNLDGWTCYAPGAEPVEAKYELKA